MKRELFGITVEEPNCADAEVHLTNKEVRQWIGYCIETILKTGCHWSSLRPGNVTVYVCAREDEYAKPHPYHVIIFRGREAYCANLTQEQADEVLAGGIT